MYCIFITGTAVVADLVAGVVDDDDGDEAEIVCKNIFIVDKND